MRRYVVRQDSDGLWWVQLQEKKLYFYTTEEAARRAALALAKRTSERGTQASILVWPSDTQIEVQDTPSRKSFTGL